MGIIAKLSDKLTEKITKTETIRLPFEQMAEIVKEEFVKGADDEFLDKVAKTAKGGNFFTAKNLESKNGRYLFHVGYISRNTIIRKKKVVYILDNETDKYYQLDRDVMWKKFYKTVDTAVKMEKINRNR